MVTLYKKEIELITDGGTIKFAFNASCGRGYREITEAISSYQKASEDAQELAKKDKIAGGMMLISAEYAGIEEIGGAIRTALGNEAEKLADVLPYMDIRGVIELATSIIGSYADYYRGRLSEGLADA